MTKEEFENLTVKEIAEVCDKNDCFECPFTKLMNMLCVFDKAPMHWVKDYMKQQNKVL